MDQASASSVAAHVAPSTDNVDVMSEGVGRFAGAGAAFKEDEAEEVKVRELPCLRRDITVFSARSHFRQRYTASKN